jgi:flagellar hook-basal body complex protein FliE
MSDIVIGGRTAPPLSALSGKTAPEKKSAPGSFGTILEGMVKDVETLQQKANEEITKVQTEQSGSIHEVMIAMEKADISFRTMMLVRNKLLEAYQEVMRLQV